MLRVERNPNFWYDLANNPEVKSTLLVTAEEFVALSQKDHVTPLAAVHGGFLCFDLSGTGIVMEFHTAFTPEGWGREVALAARDTAQFLFNKGARLLTTYEMETNPRSQPPISFGFKAHGDWVDTVIGRLRLWTLGIDSWQSSSVYRRIK